MDSLPYGTCPECGSPGVSRERRQNGNDKCGRGHTYPSSSAGTRLVKKVLPVGTKLSVTFPSLKAGDSFTLDDMGHPEGSEDGTKVYKALSDPTFKDGVWGIQTDV
jgi:hypothetical protein